MKQRTAQNLVKIASTIKSRKSFLYHKYLIIWYLIIIKIVRVQLMFMKVKVIKIIIILINMALIYYTLCCFCRWGLNYILYLNIIKG